MLRFPGEMLRDRVVQEKKAALYRNPAGGKKDHVSERFGVRAPYRVGAEPLPGPTAHRVSPHRKGLPAEASRSKSMIVTSGTSVPEQLGAGSGRRGEGNRGRCDDHTRRVMIRSLPCRGGVGACGGATVRIPLSRRSDRVHAGQRSV